MSQQRDINMENSHIGTNLGDQAIDDDAGTSTKLPIRLKNPRGIRREPIKVFTAQINLNPPEIDTPYLSRARQIIYRGTGRRLLPG